MAGKEFRTCGGLGCSLSISGLWGSPPTSTLCATLDSRRQWQLDCSFVAVCLPSPSLFLSSLVAVHEVFRGRGSLDKLSAVSLPRITMSADTHAISANQRTTVDPLLSRRTVIRGKVTCIPCPANFRSSMRMSGSSNKWPQWKVLNVWMRKLSNQGWPMAGKLAPWTAALPGSDVVVRVGYSYIGSTPPTTAPSSSLLTTLDHLFPASIHSK